MPSPPPTPTPSRVLVIGSGGREHALAWAIARSPHVVRVVVAPGNGGTAREAKCVNVDVKATDIDGLVALAAAEDVDLVVVGPEDSLAAGAVDAFRAAGRSVFGPTRDAARIESSKSWSRAFMARHGIPHPRFVDTHDFDFAMDAVASIATGDGAHADRGCVVKADGLAAGKGVVVCDTVDEGRAAVRSMMLDGRFGAAGSSVVIEERMVGPELSIMAVTDGTNYRLLPCAQDHKRIGDGDMGANTGGMGAYAPAPIATTELIARIEATVIRPALEGMRAEGHPFTGCLYAGLMLTDADATGDGLDRTDRTDRTDRSDGSDGTGPASTRPAVVPKVVEFNARFGDPETQVQLPLVVSDFSALLAAAAAGDVMAAPYELAPASAACVVLAAPGYPGAATTGGPIEGLDRVDGRAGVTVFHAGTRVVDGDPHPGEPALTVLTAGGRVLDVTCVADDLASAVRGAYAAIGADNDGVSFDGMQHRRDIAHRALETATSAASAKTSGPRT
ncbi:MAG: phosphoribosylamine--glycine ligase [Ardenticatenales bacterium]